MATSTPEKASGCTAEELAQAVEERGAAEAAASPSGFCIAITSKKVRRLHFVGSCGKIPGEHYKQFVTWGDLMPPEHEVDVVCSNCFPGGVAKAPKNEPEVSEASTSSSSSSSSSGSESPRPKKAKKSS